MALAITLFAGASGFGIAGLTDNGAIVSAVRFSALVATMNALSALWLTHLGGRRRSTRAFFGAVLGGMLFRMTATLVGFVVGLRLLALPTAALAAALLSYTLLFTGIEIALWSRQSFSPQVRLS